MKNSSSFFQYLLLLADNPLILGHRLSELCGHGPSLETDIALTNISLDLFGQVRNYFQYAAEIQGLGKSEDDLAFLRYEHEYRNVLLVEQPNHDFAWVIGRQYLFDAFHLPLLSQLSESKDLRLAGIAQKSIKEVQYHHRFSSEWVKRLGDGTEESHQKMQMAVNQLASYMDELFFETKEEKEMKEAGIGADIEKVKIAYRDDVLQVFGEAGLILPEGPWHRTKGKEGVHSEYLGFILAELQYMQRAYPNMQW
jgi:ring-1,2-phenylacetyl-CoA epoxidase subunit PaaC